MATSVVVVASLAAIDAAPAVAAPDRPGSCTIVGTSGADVLVGTPHADVICGRGGDDTLKGRGGDDVLRGGGGDDVAIGGPGDDRTVGGGGADQLRGRSGSDAMTGGAGGDKVVGGTGDDRMRGSGGDDTMKARGDASYVDHVSCGSGTDVARGDDPDVIGADCEDTGNPENTPPVAEDDTAATDEDVPLELPTSGAGSPAANDSDADGDPLTVTAVSDANGGTVAIAGGTITFTPAADLCGPAAGGFSYTVSDGNGGDDVGEVVVDIACVNDAPHAVDDTKTVAEDAAATAIDVLANDTDPEGDPISVTAVTQPAHGTVAITGGGTGLTYKPNAGYCNAGGAPDTFTYTVNGGSTATVSVTVTCVDDPPHAVDDSATVTEDSPASAIDVLANDTDPDGGPKSVQSVTQPAHGTVAITGGGTGLTYKPNAGYCNAPPGTTPDTFTYTLNGGSTATVSVTVTCVNHPADLTDDTKTVTEDAPPTAIDVLANDTDPEGDPITITAVSQPAHGTVAITGGGTGLTYKPNADYCNNPPTIPADTFTYTVADGGVATVRVTVTCVDDPPHAVNDTKTVTEDAGPTAVDVLANDTDVDGGPRTIGSVTQPLNGTVVITGGSTGLTYQPHANYCNNPPGTTLDTFTYTLNGGSTATVTVTVTCVDDPPVAANDAKTVAEDSGATAVDVLANDPDADGGPKSVQSVTQPAHGTVAITGGGTGVSYTPNANYCNNPPGTTLDTFTYTLNGGSTATVTVTVTCVDDAPHAVNDTKTVAEDSGASAVDVLANDTDTDGGPKSVQSATQPAHGTVAITGGGTGVSYTPNANYCNNPPGTTLDTFTYTLNGGSTATVTVTVTCVDDAPVAVNDTKTVAEDSGVSAVDVLANDTDVDGGPKSVQSVTQPAHGTVTITGGGTGVSYAPNANYCNAPPGTTLDTFTYTLNGGSTATVTVTVTCVNDPPVAVADAKTVAEDSGASAVDVLVNDSDAEGDPITITGVTQPAHGAVVITGGGTGLTYAPAANYCNTPPGTTLDTFTYTLNGGSTATVTMTVTCVDDPAHAVDDSKTVVEDSAATAVNVLANDTDPEGDPFSITGVVQPAHGTVAITGGGTGLTYTPNANYCNTPPGTTLDTFTYTITGGSSATVTMTVTCVDDAPAAVNNAATVAEDSGASAVDVLANDTDADGGPKSVQSVTQPAHGTVAITGGGTGLTYTPNANYCNTPPGTTLDTFTYTLNGGSSATVTVTVTCVDDPPTAVNDPVTVIEDSGANALDVLGNDTDSDGGPKSVQSVTQPAHGTVAITGGGTGLTYTPNANYCNDPPGTAPDTFTYTLNGGSTATVSVKVTCVNDAPVAGDESISGSDSAVGNTTLVVNDPSDAAPAASGPKKSVTGDILANDTDVDGPVPLTVVAGTVPTNDGGSVTLEADGDFVFTPAAGTSCTDHSDFFDYTVADGDGATDVGRVTIAITGCVWYVSNNAAGDAGTSSAPFNTLAQAQTASAANDTIYLFKGDGTTNGYDAGIVLKSGQRLLGELVPLQVGGDLLFAGTPGARPTITNTGADVVTLNAGNTVRGLALEQNGAGSGIAGTAAANNGGTIADVRIVDTGTAGTQPGLDLVGTAGTFAVSDLVVDNTAATGQTSGSVGVRLNSAGTVTFDPASTITIATKGAMGLDVFGTALGTSTFDAVSVVGSGSGGVSLKTTTGTVTFGALNVVTTGGAVGGFVLANAGTVAVTGAANTISTVGGRALSVSSTTIGASGMTFRTLSSTGADNGIVLDTTGNQGSLTVTGNGGTCTAADQSGCSGGTIASTTGGDDSGALPAGTGILLNGTLAPSFTRMWVHDHSNYAVRGTNVVGFTLASSVVNGSNGTNDASPFVDSSLRFDNLTGQASITSTVISGGAADNLVVDNTTGNLDRLTLTGVTFATSGSRPANDAVLLSSETTAGALKATVTNSTFTSAAGDLLQYDHNGIGAGDLVLTGNTFSNNHPGIATGGGGLSLFQGGNAGATTMQVNNNTFRDAVGPGILIVKLSGPTTQQGKFFNNTIGVAGVANSGSREGSALKLQTLGGGSMSWTVDGNDIRGYNNFGVEVLAGGSGVAATGAIDTRITGNTIAEPGNTAGTLSVPKQGVHLNIGTTSGDAYVACAAITGNTLDQSGADTVPSTPFDFDVRLRQRQATTIRLPGYGGANNDNAAVQTFVASNQVNPGSTAVIASNTVATGGGGFVGGAACSTPAVP